MEECEPERIVLIHIQHARNTDRTAGSIFFTEWLIVKVTLELIGKKVRKLIFGFLFSKTFFTAVSRDEFAPAAEMIDSQAAIVGTAPTFGHSGGVFERLNFLD